MLIASRNRTETKPQRRRLLAEPLEDRRLLAADQGIDFTAPFRNFTNASWSLGYAFEATQDSEVAELGFYDAGQNGLTQSHDVGLYTASGTLLARTTVTDSDPLVGFFRYSAIPSTPLIAGQQYVVSAVTGNERYTWNPAGFTVDPRIDFLGDRYVRSNSLRFPTNSTGNVEGWFGANIRFASNNDPIAVDDAGSTAEDASLTIDVLGNDSDPDSDPLTVSSVGAANNGSVVVNGDNTVTYTPNPDFVGNDTFEYTIIDGEGGSATASVAVSVTSVVDIADDSAEVDEDSSVTLNVLANDTFEDSGASVTSTTQGTNGTVTIEPDGTVTYTPDPDFNGSDSFTYTVTTATSSTTTNTETATVNVSVNSVIDAVIDVKPGNGDDVDPINLGSKGRTPIAILATQAAAGEPDDFDPTTVDLALISFEINGEAIGADKLTLEDVDGDGDLDLLIHVLTQDLAAILTPDSTELALTAEFGGPAIGNDLGGSDAIKIVPPKGKGKK